MGDPVVPGPLDRDHTMLMATLLVDSVINDEEPPTFTPMDIFRLAQDLVDMRKALNRACDLLVDEGLEESAHKLRILDLEGLGL